MDPQSLKLNNINNSTEGSVVEQVQKQQHQNGPSEQYIQYPYRWLIQISFCLSVASCGLMMNGFSPVAEIIGEVYDCDAIIVQLQTIIFIVVFVPANFIVIQTVNRYGLKVTLIIGAIALIIGCWLRMAVALFEDQFWVISFGSAIAAYGQVSFLVTVSKVSSVWFGADQRAFSTALGSLSTPLGAIMGFVLPSAIIFEADKRDHALGQKHFITYMIVQNSIATISALFLIIVAKERPPTPPSDSAEAPKQELHIGQEIKCLLKNRSYVLVAMGYAMLYGTVSAIGAIISSLTKPYNFSGKDNSLFGGLFISMGITGSLMVGVILDRFRTYKLSVVVACVAATIFMAFEFITLPSENAAFFGLNQALLGFFCIPMSPISFAFAVELTYPTPEAVTVGMILLPAKIYGAILSVVGSLLAKRLSPLYAVGLFTVNNLIAAVGSFFIIEELRRLNPKKKLGSPEERNLIDN